MVEVIVLASLLALGLAAFGGLMTAVESAMMSLSRADLADLAQRNRFGRSLKNIARDSRAHVNAVAFARTAAETTTGVVVTLILVATVSEPWVVLVVSVLVMVGVSFFLVGASPRSVGRVHATVIMQWTAPLIRFVRIIVGPIASVLVALGNRFTPRYGGSVASEKQLLNMIDDAAQEGVLEDDDKELIHSVFAFTEAVVRECMLPRTDMVTVHADTSFATTAATFFRTGVSRIPVIRDEIDDVVGIVYLRDVAKKSHEGVVTEGLTAESLAHSAIFVPDSMKAGVLLRDMQRKSNHLAMVVDEYGGIAGLVTLEDLIEELVGEISDEYDRDVVAVESLGHDRYRVTVRFPIDELGELFGLDLSDDDVESVGGWFAKALGQLPTVGSVVSVGGLRLTGERLTGRPKRLSTVIVEREKQEEESAMAQQTRSGS